MLFTVLLCVLACSTAHAAVSKCNSDITGQMESLHPSGIPTNIIQTLQKNGMYSYTVVASTDTKPLGITARCIGISMKDSATAQVTYKYRILPSTVLSFAVTEDNGVLIQTDSWEYKFYVLYVSQDGGVIITYRCCDDCGGSDVSVGIAVADSLKNKATTNTYIAEAKALLTKLNLGSDLVTLSSCSS